MPRRNPVLSEIPTKSCLTIEIVNTPKDFIFEITTQELTDFVRMYTGKRVQFIEDSLNPIHKWWVRFSFFMDLKDQFKVQYNITDYNQWLYVCRWLRAQAKSNGWKWPKTDEKRVFKEQFVIKKLPRKLLR